MDDGVRMESDPLGPLEVPADALYGVQTERARRNFPISGLRPLEPFVTAQVWIKKAAALTHRETGRLDPRLANAIVRAADEVIAGQHRDQFVVDVFQAGAGTSHNMNVNEVLANRANELLGGKRGEYKPVHPNDHVNMAQSTNDTIPTAIRLACLASLDGLVAAFTRLREALAEKGREFDEIVKAGRTHLQDAMPIRLGQEFTAYAGSVDRGIRRVSEAADYLRDLGIDEIKLPAVQPGSSIMPGKINPSIPEMVNQVCYQVMGCDTTVNIAAEHGQLELNVMMPVIAFNVLLAERILTNSATVFTDRCVCGIEANREMCEYWVERSAALATALAPHVGYTRAAELSKQSVKEGVLIRDLVRRDGILPAEQVDDVLDLRKMTDIGVPGGAHGPLSAGG